MKSILLAVFSFFVFQFAAAEPVSQTTRQCSVFATYSVKFCMINTNSFEAEARCVKKELNDKRNVNFALCNEFNQEILKKCTQVNGAFDKEAICIRKAVTENL